mgnify:CR=1 FL=1
MDLLTIQSLLIPACLMIAGIVLLIKAGDWTVESAVFIAGRYGLSPMIVGFTILAFGTSLPELLVSVLAVLRGSDGIAMGNVIGSNIANIMMVIGSACLIAKIYVTVNQALVRDVTFMLLSSLLLLGLMTYGEITRISGIFMVLILTVYVFIQYRMAQKGEQEVEEISAEHEFKDTYTPYILLLMGLAGVAVGAELLVRGASESASIIGVPEAVIALSIIAFGTSLPELSTSIIAAKKGHSDMMIGNIIGSNVFNILMIIGFTALIQPISSATYSPQLLEFDIWVMIAITVAFAFLLLGYKKITKIIGALLVAGYIAYNIFIYAIYFNS